MVNLLIKVDINDVDKRIIINPKYNTIPPTNFNLTDVVLVYYNGENWNIIPISILKCHPLINDKIVEKYVDQETDDIKTNIFDITVIYDSFTSSVAVYAGTYSIANYFYNGSLVLKNSNNDLVSAVTGKIISSTNNASNIKIQIIRKWECYIRTLRDAISEHPNCKYFNNGKLTLKPIITPTDINKYKGKYNNKCHPYTICYLIEYLSEKTSKKKYVIVVGNDSNKTVKSGLNVNKNGIIEYFSKMQHDLINRMGFTTPIYWFAWQIFFPDSKTIFL